LTIDSQVPDVQLIGVMSKEKTGRIFGKEKPAGRERGLREKRSG